MAIRLEQEFQISGLYITRNHLETLGYDTSNVNEATMQELASKVGDIVGWDGEGAEDAADELQIPQHGAAPAA